jgi:hypothetical protein
MIWIAVIVIALAGAAIIGYIWKDDKKAKEKADIEAGGSRQRRMDLLRTKIAKYTNKAQNTSCPDKREQKESLVENLKEELEGLEEEEYRENSCRELVPYRQQPRSPHQYQQDPPLFTPRRAERRDMSFAADHFSSGSIPSASRASSEGLESSIALMAQTVGQSARRTERALNMMSLSLSAQRQTTDRMNRSLRRFMEQNTSASPQIDSDSEEEPTRNWGPLHSTPVSHSTTKRRKDMRTLIEEQSALLDAKDCSSYHTPAMSQSMSKAALAQRDLADLEEVRKWLSLSETGSPTPSLR